MRKKILFIIIFSVGTLVVAYLSLNRNSVTTDLEGSVVTDQESFFRKDDLTEPTTLADELGVDDVAPEAVAVGDDGPKILVTNGIKHSVPLNKLLAGGPPKDGIPPIDRPKFESIEDADGYLFGDGLGIAVSFDGDDRFYPFQILVWHEIVNDTVGQQPVLVTYCPLCGTGIVFEPLVGGERTTFGTSGKLYQSNLVMYDRLTDTYWSQVLGEGIVGEHTGSRLTLLPYKNMAWSDWKARYPDGKVLSRATGHFRDYTRSPYGDYDTNTSVYFPVDYTDTRYHVKETIFGLEIDGQFRAYPLPELKASEDVFTDEFAGKTIQVTFDNDTDTVDFRDAADGTEIVPVYGFWFSWISVHPDTEVYTAK